MTRTPGDVVRAFVAAMSALDADGAMQLAAEDIVFENVPIQLPAGSVQGRDIVHLQTAGWMQATVRAAWTIHRQIEQGEVVMHERTDEMWFPEGLFPGGDHIALPVMAVWEVRDGSIRLWRDYYDLGMFSASLGVDMAEFGRILGGG